MELLGKTGWLKRAIKPMLLCVAAHGLVVAYLPGRQRIEALQGTGSENKASLTPVRLVLQTPKTTYRAGEPIELIAYLENVGDSPYYVGNTFAGLLGSLGLHDMRLEITDKKDREVVIGRGGGSWLWKRQTSVPDKLAQAYVRLSAGMVHGLKERLPLSLKPGRYTLTVTYREEEALRWTEAERAAVSIPVWMKPLVSNEVMITVIR